MAMLVFRTIRECRTIATPPRQDKPPPVQGRAARMAAARAARPHAVRSLGWRRGVAYSASTMPSAWR